MFVKYVLPISAAAFLGLAIYYLASRQEVEADVQPPADPPRAPFEHPLAGAGIVEPQTEDIEVGSPLPGVVVEVAVREGDRVKSGDLLFRLDDRQQQAELSVRQAALAAAEAQVQKLRSQPRPEELPVAEARVRATDAELQDARDALDRVTPLVERGVATAEELVRRRQAVHRAQSLLEHAQAELDLLKAGAWQFDLDIAAAAVAQAEAQVREVEIEIERLSVRALAAGEVLQVDVRPGEFVGAPPGQPLLVLGDVETLHVRVDIDENDIPRFREDAQAQAYPRGAPQTAVPLRFVRVEPYVVPKRSLTGDNTERVDTRVLQVIYRVVGEARLYVGQQLDVYLDVPPIESQSAAPTSPTTRRQPSEAGGARADAARGSGNLP
jgi:multidrug resistance efflux pump